MGCYFSKFMYLYWFRAYWGGDGIIGLLDTKSDELKPVFFKGVTVFRAIFNMYWYHVPGRLFKIQNHASQAVLRIRI